MSTNLIQAIDLQTKAIEALTIAVEKLTMSARVQQQKNLVYNCEDNSFQFINTPTDLSTDEGDIIQYYEVEMTGGVAPEGTPPFGSRRFSDEWETRGLGGNADRTDPAKGIGYGDPGTPPPDGCETWVDWENQLCKKANAVVYGVVKSANDIEDVYSKSVMTIDILTDILRSRGIIGTGILGYLTVGTVVTELAIPIALVYSIVSIANKALSYAGASLTNGFNDALYKDLVCAIYTGKSPAGMARNVEYVIDEYFYVVQPQSWILKFLFTSDLLNGCANRSLVKASGIPSFGFDCSTDCGGGLPPIDSWTFTSQSVEVYGASMGAPKLRQCQAIVFNSEFSPSSFIPGWSATGGEKIFPNIPMNGYQWRCVAGPIEVWAIAPNGAGAYVNIPQDWGDMEYPSGVWQQAITLYASAPGTQFTVEIRTPQ